MSYFEVLVASNKYHGSGPLTYSYELDIRPGTIVSVPLRSGSSTGIVVSNTSKPSYPVKSITSIYSDFQLAKHQIRLITWLVSYYPANVSSVVSLFIPKHFPKKITTKPETAITSLSLTKPKLPPLNEEQLRTVDAIQSNNQHSSFLIHGETGSGKTRVYIELMKKQLSDGKNCILLTPEISLTPQIIHDLKSSLNYPIYLLHSNLTEAQRRQTWIKIISEDRPSVIVGPRSALFSPVKNLGLIIIDECHDASYKQDQFPKYNALYVAGQLARFTKSKLVLGSATPNISDYYLFDSLKLPILRMTKQAVKSNHKPSIEVIDLKDKQQFTTSPYISDALIKAVKSNLSKGLQSLIFLNKRGSARLVSCNDCGWIELCPKCQIPLTFHKDQHILRCHTCGFNKPPTLICPDCQSSDIRFTKMGTKALHDQLIKLFPMATIMRFDSDSLKSEKLENNYPEVKSGKIQIILGTQILAKGLDLPYLGLVGIVSADSNLSFPDYRSEENNYQLIKQIIGRVSRGHQKGTVVIQTYNPKAKSLLAAIDGKWQSFYEDQLAQRREYDLPPFSYILKIHLQRKNLSSIHQIADKILDAINKLDLNLQISGPSPRFNELAMGHYNWQLIVKSKKRSQLLTVIQTLPKNINYDIDPINLL